MRAIILGLLVLSGGTSCTVTAASAASHRIKAYTTSRGTYVAPARATNPNRSKLDNYSTKPNVNPYTGAKGTKKPKW